MRILGNFGSGLVLLVLSVPMLNGCSNRAPVENNPSVSVSQKDYEKKVHELELEVSAEKEEISGLKGKLEQAKEDYSKVTTEFGKFGSQEREGKALHKELFLEDTANNSGFGSYLEMSHQVFLMRRDVLKFENENKFFRAYFDDQGIDVSTVLGKVNDPNTSRLAIERVYRELAEKKLESERVQHEADIEGYKANYARFERDDSILYKEKAKLEKQVQFYQSRLKSYERTYGQLSAEK